MFNVALDFGMKTAFSFPLGGLYVTDHPQGTGREAPPFPWKGSWPAPGSPSWPRPGANGKAGSSRGRGDRPAPGLLRGRSRPRTPGAAPRRGCALLGSGCYVGPLVDSIIQGRETGAARCAGAGWPPWAGRRRGGGAAAGEHRRLRRRRCRPCPSPSTRPCARARSTTRRSTVRRRPSPRARRTAAKAASSLMTSLEADATGQRTRPTFPTSPPSASLFPAYP